MCRYLSFQTVNLPFQTVNLSFQVVLSIILTVKTIKIPINLSFVIVFHVKIQHKTTNLSFCIVFVSKKLPRHETLKNNYRLNDTIIYFCYRVVSFRVVGQKNCYRRTLPRANATIHFDVNCIKIDVVCMTFTIIQ